MTFSHRLLLVTPAFHGYHRSIARAFSARGYDVVTHCYDAFATLGEKFRNKALIELPSRFGADTYEAARAWSTARALAALTEANPTRLVVIKGDTLGGDFWHEVASRGLPRILWLYDDVARHHFDDSFLRWIGPVVSYARSEAAELVARGVAASFIPNAFDPDLARPSSRRSGEVVFVGSRYPNRVALLAALREAGLPIRAYGRQWSHHPFDRLRTWELSRPALQSERDIPLARAYSVQAEAAAALNVHGLQAGLAMRSFEVPGMGGLQLVDRPDIAEFYEVGTEALVFGSTDELVDLATRSLRDRAWSERIRAAGRRRSLAEHTFAHRISQVDSLWA
ncbi:glycosyltransferase [Sinomonas sp. ASV322]|uniref:CgeB family protein n=1 Tax=Sinomonas sp. ASV322 TaxID=3041920 RepID=UPI0027DDD361|nr:glycosyltransferase [Sinomonas sp. ASV322]MDQ4501902.1 glycosyltransferase [Sinomonas sp. ASV322]